MSSLHFIAIYVVETQVELFVSGSSQMNSSIGISIAAATRLDTEKVHVTAVAVFNVDSPNQMSTEKQIEGYLGKNVKQSSRPYSIVCCWPIFFQPNNTKYTLLCVNVNTNFIMA